jgi:hypothetical protein
MTGLPDRPADRSQRAVPAAVASVVGTAGCSRLGADGIYNCSADKMTFNHECVDPSSDEDDVRLARE